MSALSRFEQFVEQLVEGSFTRLMRSQLQPVEIAKKLARVMEDSQAVGAGGRIVVANKYEVLLNPKDYSLFEPYRSSLERELTEYVVSAAKEQQFFLASQPSVTISSSPNAVAKRPLVKASKSDVRNSAEDAAALLGQTTRLNVNIRPAVGAQRKAYLQPTDAANASRIPMSQLPYHMGRGLENDLVLEDSRVSRQHARIEELNSRLLILDLRSTNGTFVNGESVSKCLLNNGDVISLGGVEFLLTLEDKG